jgi:hypothetical protein
VSWKLEQLNGRSTVTVRADTDSRNPGDGEKYIFFMIEVAPIAWRPLTAAGILKTFAAPTLNWPCGKAGRPKRPSQVVTPEKVVMKTLTCGAVLFGLGRLC